MEPLTSPGHHLQHYLRLAQRTDETSFLEACPHPVLVHRAFRPGDTTGFQTLTGASEANAALINSWVSPVVKRECSNAFTGMITIGRAGNNDVVIRFRSVSKFHGYVQAFGHEYELVDANSSYGTRVDGLNITESAAGRARLGLENTIVFGTFESTWFQPGAFYGALRALLQLD